MRAFLNEFGVLGRLIKIHYVAIIVVCVATALIIVMDSTKLNTSLLYSFGDHHINGFIYYGIIPLAVLLILRIGKPISFGLGLGDYKFWIPASITYLAVALPLIYFTANALNVSEYYEAYSFKVDWPTYILNTTILLLGWEYFFRGFMLEGLRNSLKEGAILVQMIPFTLLHLGKPDAETLGCIVSGLLWGYICYRARCYWPALIMHWVVNMFTKALSNNVIG